MTATAHTSEACSAALAATHALFAPNFGAALDVPRDARALRLGALLESEYATRDAAAEEAVVEAEAAEAAEEAAAVEADAAFEAALEAAPQRTKKRAQSQALVLAQPAGKRARRDQTRGGNLALALYEKLEAEKPEWHAPWKLMRVVSGHTGWVKAIAVDHSNEWFATGSADRTIKVWDLASGKLKISLTGHISTIRGLAISARSPYLFSVAEDKMVKCWDLETNKVTRHYHGHLSGIYCATVHPTLDVLITGGRDATARVWDIRTKACVHVLGGHRDTIWDIAAQAAEPQIITGSADKVVRTWDLAAGKTLSQLTHHKKQIRSIALHPTEYSFATAGADNIKKWKCPEARFMLNFSGHNSIINTLQCNGSVMFSGGDNGSMRFWDWRTGYCFQREETRVQPGSLDAEAGIFASSFDMTGSRLITCEADKTIKFWKEDPDATEETHPIDPLWRKQIKKAKRI